MGPIEEYLALGLRLGRHVDGLVDAYYGPPALQRRVADEELPDPARLARDAARLIADLDAGVPLAGGPERGDEPDRRRWLRAQVVGLHTTARRLAGEPVGYEDEVEACYGVRPVRPDPEAFLAARRDLESVIPGSEPLGERLEAWRDRHDIDPALLPKAVASLCEEFRERTAEMFGLPEGEHVDFEFVTGQPWSGFNYYLGDLRSRVAVNTDLPVRSLSLGHLVAHEAYPGHHTEHTRKEAGLVRGRHQLEETIFLVGTPQCLLAEGLADLGIEVILGRHHEAILEEHFRPLGIPYDAEGAAVVGEASEALGGVRQHAAFRLHVDGVDPEVVIDEIADYGLTSRGRAAKSVEFLMHPTWRAYLTCYVEGLPLCRDYVRGEPERFARLLNRQMVPADLM